MFYFIYQVCLPLDSSLRLRGHVDGAAREPVSQLLVNIFKWVKGENSWLTKKHGFSPHNNNDTHFMCHSGNSSLSFL